MRVQHGNTHLCMNAHIITVPTFTNLESKGGGVIVPGDSLSCRRMWEVLTIHKSVTIYTSCWFLLLQKVPPPPPGTGEGLTENYHDS